jgi:hypothetical protein
MYNLNYTPTTLGYTVEKLYLGVREQERLNTTGLEYSGYKNNFFYKVIDFRY